MRERKGPEAAAGQEPHGSEFGFKDLTAENYLQPDDIMERFVTAETGGGIRQIGHEEWAAEILSVRLGPTVPNEVRQLFLVARGAMVYGYFFYPIYALAVEQLLRVAEAGVSFKCRELGAPVEVRNFRSRIEWLKERGIFSEGEAASWHSLRGLRNSASHPAYQMILPPGPALTMLQRVAAEVDNLFGDAAIGRDS